ncbi:MAG: D-cysteine desulfhydrase family protein [Bacteroidota bacterium]|nr:D-cysteine desulfhydrase family protein [Bacteroidota bacterium]
MKTGKDILEQFPKISLSLLPTPLHKLKNISAELSRNIYCKRDDLTGFGFGGNKTRKLDFLIADALKRKANTIVAVGAVQSNFCRIAAAAGRTLGFDVHLVLGGIKPEKPTGNLLLNNLFGAKIYFVNSNDWNVWENKAKKLMKELTLKGRKVYWLPVGGSTHIGVLGYVNAFFEILEDCKQLGVIINTIIHATSSGGTQAGLIIGKRLTRWQGKIIGMGVAKTKKQLSKEVFELVHETGKLLWESITSGHVFIDKKDVIVNNSYMGSAYGERTSACESAIKFFAEKEGIVLDHVYTGKAAAGLIDYAKQKIFKPKENILFIHTGGNVEMFE